MTRTNYKQKSYILLITISVFFFWGFTASGNALLIPVLKEKFKLTQSASQYVEFAFYSAYFLGSLVYFLISKLKSESIKKLGPAKIMTLGLLISTIGTLLLIFSSGGTSYAYVLLSLFVIALGFSLQQIIANYILISIGQEAGGAQRLILAGAINSLGNTIAPVLLSHFMFNNESNTDAILQQIKPILYFISCLYILFAVFFYRTKIDDQSQVPNTMEATPYNLLKLPQLWAGMIAIFFYVGCEVSLQSNLPALVASNQILGLETKDAIQYFSLFGGSLLIGRWTGAVHSFNLSKTGRLLFIIAMPVLAFSVILLVNFINGTDLVSILDYTPWLLSISAIIFFAGTSPRKTLILSAATATAMVLGSLVTTGKTSMYLIICTANFSALMWPCIFALTLRKLGNNRQDASSVLIMMLIGGAVIPPLQGALADISAIGIKNSFMLPVVGYIVILTYGIFVNKIQSYSHSKIKLNKAAPYLMGR